jgi:hypothetical protein
MIGIVIKIGFVDSKAKFRDNWEGSRLVISASGGQTLEI